MLIGNLLFFFTWIKCFINEKINKLKKIKFLKKCIEKVANKLEKQIKNDKIQNLKDLKEDETKI